MEVMDAVVPSVTSPTSDDDAPTVEETYEITTTRRKTIRTSYKIQEVLKNKKKVLKNVPIESFSSRVNLSFTPFQKMNFFCSMRLLIEPFVFVRKSSTVQRFEFQFLK